MSKYLHVIHDNESGQYNLPINRLTINYLTDSDLQMAINIVKILVQEEKTKE